MHPVLKGILGVVLGCMIGGIVNILLIMIGPFIIPVPSGADLTTMEGLKASMHLMGPQHFIFPFLAHAAHGFLAGFIAAKIATIRKFHYALIASAFVLLGGIINVIQLPSPIWFGVLDLALAYIPMGYLGYRLAIRNQSEV